ncbi:10593_t:CDS:2 [Ambispora gerdemannii]|uniref:10593_t:CDS:1 n=1 Tax=Ambispora gerdemannii TaxID=144530 RepID=A0A9N9DYY2_9GLOM|nr:10593_t:CDS:2 [Ambispora gerdemannii]
MDNASNYSGSDSQMVVIDGKNKNFYDIIRSVKGKEFTRNIMFFEYQLYFKFDGVQFWMALKEFLRVLGNNSVCCIHTRFDDNNNVFFISDTGLNGELKKFINESEPKLTYKSETEMPLALYFYLLDMYMSKSDINVVGIDYIGSKWKEPEVIFFELVYKATGDIEELMEHYIESVSRLTMEYVNTMEVTPREWIVGVGNNRELFFGVRFSSDHVFDVEKISPMEAMG